MHMESIACVLQLFLAIMWDSSFMLRIRANFLFEVCDWYIAVETPTRIL